MVAAEDYEQRRVSGNPGRTNGVAPHPPPGAAALATLARVYLDDPVAATALASALREALCLAMVVERRVVEVLLDAAATDADQARMELAFFLSAWRADHPGSAPRATW
jgi:hypothetical protein